MSVYYNDIDPNARAWTAELMRRGFIPHGDIDDRSIELVQPGDVAGYDQCHFFCGISVWAYAGQEASWGERPWWTASCPCQPFSVSGKRRGTADPRHLWPHLFRLIRACRPAVVMGEQVAQKAGWNWFNGVRADLAGEAYQCRGIGLCSCAVDSPDERERIYWCAVADSNERCNGTRKEIRPRRNGFGVDDGTIGPLVNGARIGRGEGWSESSILGGRGAATSPDASGAMGHGDSAGLSLGISLFDDARSKCAATERANDAADRPMGNYDDHGQLEQEGCITGRGGWPGNANGRNRSWYADHEWIACHDGKKRRAKPGTSMLVAGSPGRIPMWRGLGGSINAQLAIEVIRAFIETET